MLLDDQRVAAAAAFLPSDPSAGLTLLSPLRPGEGALLF